MQKITSDISTLKSKTPELLLPVGNKEMALAAIHNGADAIFLGVPGFNARGRSHDFELETLREIVKLCQLYRVKVNLAFNVVVFQDEIESVALLLHQLLALNPTAFIVQDLGLVQLIRKMAPQQRIHASTQMTVTNHEAIQLLEDLDIKRFVLGRENSIEDIKKIREQTDRELETFVHGALCVSYSGQCFTSESIGGRSANRGQCAQSCRFGYELNVDGERKELGGKKYLVSPKDLCGLDDVSQLILSGVDCFKIEGRLKTPEYVATAAQAYRAAIENAQGRTDSEFQPEVAKKNMGISYSRGFFSGWLNGVDHQNLVGGHFGSHRGHEIGTVIDIFKNTMTILVKDSGAYQSLVAGDGLLWVKNNREQGGFIYGIEKLPKSRVRIELARDIKLFGDLDGATVYQNHDKELKRSVSLSVDDKTKKKRLGVTATITIVEGEPLRVTLSDSEFCVGGETSSVLVPAQNRGLTDEVLKDEFNSLLGSIFRLQDITISRNSQTPLFLAAKELKQLRQQLVAELTAFRQGPPQGGKTALQILNTSQVLDWVQSKKRSTMLATTVPRLNILLREKGQVSDLVGAIKGNQIDVIDLDTVILDFEFGRDYAPSVSELKNMGVRVGIATTRVLKPNEYRNLKVLAELKPDSILVRNLGALFYLQQENAGNIELRGDFSLNVTNHLTADYLLQKGLASLCLSYDLNNDQVRELLENSHANRMEVTVFQYMPSFHMEHCVFAAYLSNGSSYRDCGKPCEKHDVRLKDQFQNWHQIKADQECRNTMFSAKSQSAGRYISDWANRGLGFVRIEALKERGNELITKIVAHRDLLSGKIGFAELVEKIGAIESYGISEGQFGKDKEYQSRKKLQIPGGKSPNEDRI
jgi:putative protease